MPKRRRSEHPPRINVRVTEHLRSRLDKLAAFHHLRLSDYVRVKLEEIAKQESLAATGGQS